MGNFSSRQSNDKYYEVIKNKRAVIYEICQKKVTNQKTAFLCKMVLTI